MNNDQNISSNQNGGPLISELSLHRGILAWLWFSYAASWASLTIPMLITCTSIGLIFPDYQEIARQFKDTNYWGLLACMLAGGLGVNFGLSAIERFKRG